MCVTRKLCIVCFLASYLLSFSPTTSETTQKNGQMHIHDHDGYQIAEKSKEEIAKLESRYFVTKIFEKYGGANGTLTYDMFENLMLNLGLGKNNSIFKHLNTTANDTNEHHTGHDPHMENHEHDHEGNHHPKDLKDSHSKDQKDDHGHQDTEDHQEHRDQQDAVDAHDSHDHQGSHDGHDHQDNDDGHDHKGSHDDHDHQDNHDGHDHQDNHNHEEHLGHTEIDQSLDATTTVGESKRESNKDKKPENSRKKSTDKKKRKKKKKNKKKNSARKNIQKRSVEHHSDHSLCLSSMELLKTFHYDERNLIDEESFIYLCPALLFQIESDSCRRDVVKRRPLHDDHGHNHHHHDKKSNSSVIMNTIKDINNIAPKVWGYSTIAVVVISLAGLFGVAVIPIMQKVFYNHLLQFLVALAVGALSGDALLHLLPHAIAGGHSAQGHDDHGHGEGDDGHDGHLKSTYKGLIALTGIFFFFLMERILTIMTDLKRKRKQTKRLQNQTPHKQCQVESDKAVGAKLSTHTDSDYQTCEEMVMIVHPNKALRNLADDTHDSLLHGHHHDHHSSSRIPEDDESFHSLKSNSHHGHGHSHTISGDVKSQSIAAIAWMVILGDGIHNFSDGLAIGAAFANSITGGISTSIAVMCHELPHEIGDFAVLLRAGMNIKQAIMYNCVSSILCFIGMFIGVALGNLNEASLWIFACVGGMFLYIALVDMLPEMTSVETKHGENPYCHLVFQCAGMILGAGIMLIIAIFEPDLLSALDRQ